MTNPNTHIILDEITWRFTDHDAKWGRRFFDQEVCWEATFSDFAVEQKTRVREVEKAARLFDDWRMSLEGVVDDLRQEVGKLSKNWECALIDKSSMIPGVLTSAPGYVANALSSSYIDSK